MKKCSKCKEEKPVGDFYMDRRRNRPQAQCKQCHKASSIEARRNSPEKREAHKAYMREYNERQGVREKQKEWQDSPEGQEWIKAYRRRDHVKAAQRKRVREQRQTPEGKAYITSWRNENRETVTGYSRRYRAKLKDALVPGFAEPTMDVLKSFYGAQCMWPGCEDERLELEHIVPISRGGKHTYYNAQILCRSHNASKHASTVDYRDGCSEYGKLIDRVITK